MPSRICTQLELQNFPQLDWADVAPRMATAVRSAVEDVLDTQDGARISREKCLLLANAEGDDLLGLLVAADLLRSELGPYGHVRFNLNGDALFLPDKLAVSLALIFHELATNAGKYGAFSSPHGLLQVSWTVTDDRLNITWDETEGPPVENIGKPGFGTKLLNSALLPFNGKTDISFLKSGVHCTMQCRIPAS